MAKCQKSAGFPHSSVFVEKMSSWRVFFFHMDSKVESEVVKENQESKVIEIMPFRPYNRGKKLKVLHDQPFSSLNSRPSLWHYHYHEEQTEVRNV